jgi:hypothetical protein
MAGYGDQLVHTVYVHQAGRVWIYRRQVCERVGGRQLGTWGVVRVRDTTVKVHHHDRRVAIVFRYLGGIFFASDSDVLEAD